MDAILMADRQRPHVLGWGEDGPEVVDNQLCDLCGKTGAHDIIVLGKEETAELARQTRTLGPRVERSLHTAKVELKVKRGYPSIGKGVRINGFELPRVTAVNIEYPVRDARSATIKLLPTDVIEVDEAEW